MYHIEVIEPKRENQEDVLFYLDLNEPKIAIAKTDSGVVLLLEVDGEFDLTVDGESEDSDGYSGVQGALEFLRENQIKTDLDLKRWHDENPRYEYVHNPWFEIFVGRNLPDGSFEIWDGVTVEYDYSQALKTLEKYAKEADENDSIEGWHIGYKKD